jgi:transposase
MGACAGAHDWAGELRTFGEDVGLIPPSGVKPVVKRGKTDAAICEADTRPSMQFVAVKTTSRQAVLRQHRTRDFLVRQLTQLANAICVHRGEFGLVVPKVVHTTVRLLTEAETADLPTEARVPLDLLAGQFRYTTARVETLTPSIKALAKADETAPRLQTAPGNGPITESVPAATLHDLSAFRSARDLTAWLGVQSVSRADRVPACTAETALERWQGAAEFDLEDAQQIHPAAHLSWCPSVIPKRRKSGPSSDWLGGIIASKPLKVAAIALANRMARALWAMLKTGDDRCADRPAG